MFWRAPPYLFTQRIKTLSSRTMRAYKVNDAFKHLPELDIEHRSICEVWHALNVEDLLHLSPTFYYRVYCLGVDIQLWRQWSRAQQIPAYYNNNNIYIFVTILVVWRDSCSPGREKQNTLQLGGNSSTCWLRTLCNYSTSWGLERESQVWNNKLAYNVKDMSL